MKYLENLTFLRQAISDKKYLFSGNYIKDMINHPKHLRRKTLLLLDVHLAGMEEKDIRKCLGSRYKVVAPEKYHQDIAEKIQTTLQLPGEAPRWVIWFLYLILN